MTGRDQDLVVQRPEGLFCPQGGFYIDPWRTVDKAVITHCHADHARWGMGQYICAARALPLIKARLGVVNCMGLGWGESLSINGVKISFHPAGHILGAAQVRLEYRGQVWVCSGDYKVEPDRTCDSFEPVQCHTFITESTFGLPIYSWQPQEKIFSEINTWWHTNREQGRHSVLYGYSLGKAQRLLAGVEPQIGPLVCHNAVQVLNRAYESAGIQLPPAFDWSALSGSTKLQGALIIAPPAVAGSSQLARIGPYSDAFASGWMQLRGARRRRAMDRGFVLSDHADWPGLLKAIRATGAQRVIVTHGYVAVLVRWLTEAGLQAEAFTTEFGDEAED